jgi:hypothetical protein
MNLMAMVAALAELSCICTILYLSLVAFDLFAYLFIARQNPLSIIICSTVRVHAYPCVLSEYVLRANNACVL